MADNQSASPIASYGYDTLGRRSYRTFVGTTTRYSYNGRQILAEYDGSDTLLRKFIDGPGIDEPICMLMYNAQGTETGRVFYHFDALGSVIALSQYNTGNGYAQVVQHYGYTAFGHERYKHNTAAFDVTNRYTGQHIDEETGLYFYQSRYYDPELGRFTQADSIVPGSDTSQALNRYAYVKNNPLKFTDPDGHGWFSKAWKQIKGWIGTIATVALAPWLGPLAPIVGSAIGTLVNGGTFKSFAIGVAIGFAAGAIAGGLGSAMNGGGFGAGVGSYLNGVGIECIVGNFAAGAITGAVAGGISSAIYGGNWGQNMLSGAAGGAIGAGVGMATKAIGTWVKGMSATKQLACANGLGFMTATDSPQAYPEYQAMIDSILSSRYDAIDIADYEIALATGEDIGYIGEKEWDAFLDSARCIADESSKLNPLAPMSNGDTLYDNDQKLYSIPSIGKISRGYEINYILQGMIYNRSWVYNKITCYELPQLWKLSQMPFSNKWWKIPMEYYKNREPYQPLSRDEKFYTHYGFKHYNN